MNDVESSIQQALVQALQFEWAWQKPRLSRTVREVAARLKLSDRSCTLPNKIQIMMAMLHLSPWQHLPLTVHFLSSEHAAYARRQCPPPPEQIRLDTGNMEDLKRLMGATFGDEEDGEDGAGEGGEEEEGSMSMGAEVSASQLSHGGGGGGGRGRCCALCAGEFRRGDATGGGGGGVGGEDGGQQRSRRVGCPACGIKAHPSCMASHFFQLMAAAAEAARQPPPPPRLLVPQRGACPACEKPLSWGSVIAAGFTITTATASGAACAAPAAPAKGGVTSSRARAKPAVAAAAPSRKPLKELVPAPPSNAVAEAAERRVAERARIASWANGTCSDFDDDDDDGGGGEEGEGEVEEVGMFRIEEEEEVLPLAERLLKRRRPSSVGAATTLSISP